MVNMRIERVPENDSHKTTKIFRKAVILQLLWLQLP